MACPRSNLSNSAEDLRAASILRPDVLRTVLVFNPAGLSNDVTDIFTSSHQDPSKHQSIYSSPVWAQTESRRYRHFLPNTARFLPFLDVIWLVGLVVETMKVVKVSKRIEQCKLISPYMELVIHSDLRGVVSRCNK